ASSRARTWCATSSSVTSSTPTPSTTNRYADDDRCDERIRSSDRGDGIRLPRPPRARRDARAPAGRTRDPVRHPCRYDGSQRAMDGRGRAHRRALLPHGRTAPRGRGRPERGGDPRLSGALPTGRRRTSPGGRPLRGGGDAPAHHPRDLAPPRFRPRGTRGRTRDVRSATPPAPHLPGRCLMGVGSAQAVPVVLLAFLSLGAIAASAVLSAGEEAGRAVTKAAAADAVAEGKKRADVVAHLAEDSHLPVRATAYIRLVLEMTGAVSLTLIALTVFHRWWSVLLAAIIVSALVMLLVVGVSPRSFGRRNPVAVLRFVGPFMLTLARFTAPGRKLRRNRSEEEEELTEAAERQPRGDRGAGSADVADDQREMLHSVFELSHTVVREIMVPRTDMLTLHYEESVEDALTLFVRSGYSRIPVIGENVDDLRGVMYLKDTLRYTWHNSEKS